MNQLIAVANPGHWGGEMWGMFLVGGLIVIGFGFLLVLKLSEIVKKPIAAIAKEVAGEVMNTHNADAASHAVYRNSARAEMMSRVGEAEIRAEQVVNHHNLNEVAHYVALRSFATGKDLENAIDKQTIVIDALKESLFSLARGQSEQIEIIRKIIERGEREREREHNHHA